MIRNHILLGAALAAAAFVGLTPATAQIDEFSVVYIECRDAAGDLQSQGSGVVISDRGEVLTARHVIGDDLECSGALGTSARGADWRMSVMRESDRCDAALLRFGHVPGANFIPVQTARLESDMRGAPITAYGFPPNAGELSARSGNLATTSPKTNCLVESTSITASGMSGGPVIITDGRLIGIVAGAQFGRQGEVTHIGVLAIEAVVDDFSVLTPARACRHPEHGVERYETVLIETRDSGWRRGGSPGDYCEAQKSGLQSSYPGAVVTIEETGERQRWHWIGIDRQRQHRYSCRIRIEYNPIYREEASEHCG